MKNLYLVYFLISLGTLCLAAFTGFIIFLFINKEKELNKLILQFVFLGLVGCGVCGSLHNVFVNPFYFQSLINLDFNNPDFLSFIIVWYWRFGFIFFTYSLILRHILKKAKNWKNKKNIFKVIFTLTAFLSLAWLTDIEKFFIYENTRIDMHHLLHWLGGIIGPFMFIILVYVYREKDIIKYINIKENFQKIRDKFIFVFCGILILVLLTLFGIIIGCIGHDNSYLLLIKLTFFSIFFVSILILIILKFTREFSRDLNQAVLFLKSAAKLNFTGTINIESKDEFGELGNSLQTLKLQFKQVMNSVINSADDVNNSAENIDTNLIEFSNNINNFFSHLKENAESQIETSHESSNNIDQMTNKISDIASNIIKQSTLISKNSNAIDEISITNLTITTLTESANVISSNLYDEAQLGKGLLLNIINSMHEIEDSSKKIFEINSIIDDISNKTKLLAINAAIEAARTGETGKSFSIVAHELRKLAENTAGNAKNISSLIDEITKKIAQSLEHMDSLDNQFKRINDHINETKKTNMDISEEMKEENRTLNNIIQTSSKLNDITNQINDYSEILKESSNNIKKSFIDIKDLFEEEAEKTITSSSFVVETVENMKKMLESNIETAEKLKTIIDKFKLDS